MHRQRMKRLVAFVLGLCLIFGLTPNMQVKVAASEGDKHNLTLKVWGMNAQEGVERTYTTDKQPYADKAEIAVEGTEKAGKIEIDVATLKDSFKGVYRVDLKADAKLQADTEYDLNSKSISILPAAKDSVKLVIPAENQGVEVVFNIPEKNIKHSYLDIKDAVSLKKVYDKFVAEADVKDFLQQNAITQWNYQAEKEGTSEKLLDGQGGLDGKDLPKVTYLVLNAVTQVSKVDVNVSALKLGSDTEYIREDASGPIEEKSYTLKELGEKLKKIAKVSDFSGSELNTIFVQHDGETTNTTINGEYTPKEGDRFILKWTKKDDKKDDDLVWFDATPSTIRSEIDDERKEKKKAVFDTKVSRKVTISTGKNRKATITDIPIPERYFNETLNTMMEFDYWTDIDMRKYWKNNPLLENTTENPHYLDLTKPENVTPHKNNEDHPFYALYKPMAKVEVNFYYTGDPGITIYTGKDYILRRPIIVYFSEGTPITLEELGKALDGKLGKDNTIQSIKYLDPESGVDKVFNLLPELATLNGNPMNILSEEGSTYDSNVVKYHKNRMDIVKLYYAYNQNAVTVLFDNRVPNVQEAAKVGTPKPKVTEKGMYINAPTDWQPARRRGYTFQGWYPTPEDAAALTNEISFPYMVQEDITLYAGWEGNKVYIIYRYNNGMGTEYKLARNGEMIPEPSFPVPYWPGMKFSGWYMTLGPEKGIAINNAGPKDKEEKKEEGQENAQKQWPLKGFRIPIDDPYLRDGNKTPGYITDTVVNGPMLVDAMWTPLVTTSSLTKPDQAAAPQTAANQVGTNPANAANLPEAGEHNYSFVVGGFLALAAGIFLLKRKAF